MATPKDKFYLFANCNFVPDRYPDWQAAYDNLHEHVWAKEPTTESYYFGIPFDYAHDFNQTTRMLAFEVYTNREGLYTTHFSSPAMAKFLSQVPPTMTTGLDLAHYALIEGFLDKPGDKRECGVMQDWKITCNDSAGRKSLAGALGNLATKMEQLEEAEAAGIWTFMVFESLDNETDARIFARFRDRDAMEKALRKEQFESFWLENKEKVKSMDCRAYLPNGKGWLHR